MNFDRLTSLTAILTGSICLLACASNGGRSLDPRLTVHGPGNQFMTVEAAVIDALAFTHIEGLRDGTRGRLRGGVITRTDRGFTYSTVSVAAPERPTRIVYSLLSQDVARFHVYPISASPGENARNDRPSRQDRRSVDQGDPLHRPLFVLTPRMVVKSYSGDGQDVTTIADLRSIDFDQLVAALAH